MIAVGPAASGGDTAGFDERALARPGACDFGRDADGILTSLGYTLRRLALFLVGGDCRAVSCPEINVFVANWTSCLRCRFGS